MLGGSGYEDRFWFLDLFCNWGGGELRISGRFCVEECRDES